VPAIRVLLPPLAIVARDAPPPFRTLLARADRLGRVPRGREAAIARAFSSTPAKPLAVAPLLRDAEVGDAGDALWICADPGHARADAGALRLLRSGDLGLAREEADDLLRDLKPLFGDSGFELSAGTPDHWYLRGIASDQRPEAPDPFDILGDDLEPHVPRGRDGAKWASLLNEAQMRLHQHRVNAARAARGVLPANTLWFWGAGRRPPLNTAYASVATTDRVVRVVAQAAGASLLADAAIAAGPMPALIELWSPEAWREFCATGHASVVKRLGHGADVLELETWDGERFAYRRGHRWRFWRKPK
jgi:hypothetical protein